jgi:hypothetical protein
MSPESKKGFNDYSVDELRELYQTDPELFEELADDAIEKACIGSNPAKTLKRKQMQWIIDAQLQKAKTALGRMQIMENIFYTKVYGIDGQLAQLMSSCTDLFRAVTGTEQVTVQKPRLCLAKK